MLGCGRKTSDLLGWLAAQLRALSTHYHLNTPKSWRKFSHGTQAKVVSSKTKWEMREPARCSSPTGGPLASSPARRKTRSPGGWERGRSEGPPHARFVCCEYLKASPLSRKGSIWQKPMKYRCIRVGPPDHKQEEYECQLNECQMSIVMSVRGVCFAQAAVAPTPSAAFPSFHLGSVAHHRTAATAAPSGSRPAGRTSIVKSSSDSGFTRGAWPLNTALLGPGSHLAPVKKAQIPQCACKLPHTQRR